MFKKLGSRQVLSHTVQEQIESAIQSRTLAPGDRLPTELELCSQFGVSRTVLREALRGLSAKGLVSIEKGRGMFIRELTASFVVDPMRLYLSLNFPSVGALEVVQARQVMEPAMAALAARNRTSEMVQELKENLEKMKQLTGNLAAFAETDGDFHVLLARATCNPILPLVIEPIRKLMPKISMALYEVVEEARDMAILYHTRLFEAIEAGKEESARRCMVEHLKAAEQHIRATLEHKQMSNFCLN